MDDVVSGHGGRVVIGMDPHKRSVTIEVVAPPRVASDQGASVVVA